FRNIRRGPRGLWRQVDLDGRNLLGGHGEALDGEPSRDDKGDEKALIHRGGSARGLRIHGLCVFTTSFQPIQLRSRIAARLGPVGPHDSRRDAARRRPLSSWGGRWGGGGGAIRDRTATRVGRRAAAP